jgi:hypothetical protein
MLHYMKKIFLTASMAVCFLAGKAQFATDYLKAADSYFIKGDYYSAAQYYEKYFTGRGPVQPSRKLPASELSPKGRARIPPVGRGRFGSIPFGPFPLCHHA